jgi:hypothetical protein
MICDTVYQAIRRPGTNISPSFVEQVRRKSWGVKPGTPNSWEIRCASWNFSLFVSPGRDISQASPDILVYLAK